MKHTLSMLWAMLLATTAWAAPPAMPPAPVKFIIAQPQPLTEQVVFTARLQPRARVEVRPRVGGVIERVAFRDSERVRKDQLLYEIDSRPYAAEVARA